MKIRTSYNSGPYVVTHITEGCTCPNCVDYINLGNKAPKSRPHTHLTCKGLDSNRQRGNFYLNGYDENLRSVWNNDYLIDLDELAPAILSLLL